jgi:hypothetical protein
VERPGVFLPEPRRRGVQSNSGPMGKALVAISLLSLVAIVTMLLSSFDHREWVQLQRDILATKMAESRDFPTTGNRNEAIEVTDDSAFPVESLDSGELLEVHQGEGSSPLPVARPGVR